MSENSQTLDALDIVNYLQQNPEFFNQHTELLETLLIPHPVTGNTVSLIARQLEIFRNKQSKLENQLKSLLSIAKDNDEFSTKMHQLTLMLLKSVSIDAVVETLYQTLKKSFLIDFVSLKIIAKDCPKNLESFFMTSDEAKTQGLDLELKHDKPYCGSLDVCQMQFLFPNDVQKIRSSAIVPIPGIDLSILLVLASPDDERFHFSKDNLFLTQLSQIVSSRINVLLQSKI